MGDRSRRNKNKSEVSEKKAMSPKREPSSCDEEEDGAPPDFWTAALGLRPVGAHPPPQRPVDATQPHQKLNARGMPARIRKKNRLFFDDDIVNAPPPRSSPKRGPRTTPVKTPNKASPSSARKLKPPAKRPRLADGAELSPRAEPDPKVGQRVGNRLRNLLKLNKAQRWVCFEHFYSDIDRALFSGENDFRICLRETFPRLADRNLTQVQWTKIRRIMGKPRRCSQAFFDEERKDLDSKRHKIRFIQQRKMGHLSWKDLPNEIPMQLVIGTKVTARLRKPQDGLFTGVIDGVDTSDNTYRITFERPGLGTHSVPDHEVLSNEPPDTIDLSALGQKCKPRHSQLRNLMSLYRTAAAGDRSDGDPLLGGAPAVKLENSAVGSYTVKFLESLVRITKILNAKKARISKLRDFNCEVERRESFGESAPEDFERRYAAVVIELERMNLDLQRYLNDVQVFCHEMAPGLCMAAMLAPSHLREKYRSEATDIVQKVAPKPTISENSIRLITDLTALLLEIKSLSDSRQNAYELKVLQGTMQQIKMKLSESDHVTFQNCVEIHMKPIQSWLGTPNSLSLRENSVLINL